MIILIFPFIAVWFILNRKYEFMRYFSESNFHFLTILISFWWYASSGILSHQKNKVYFLDHTDLDLKHIIFISLKHLYVNNFSPHLFFSSFNLLPSGTLCDQITSILYLSLSHPKRSKICVVNHKVKSMRELFSEFLHLWEKRSVVDPHLQTLPDTPRAKLNEK